MPHLDRPEPPYLQIVRHIREQIVSGQLAEGDAVPSARQIATEWKIAHATAAKVLTTLRSEGLVQGVAGVGTVVAAQALDLSARDHSIAMRKTGRIYPPGHYARIRAAELTEPPDSVAAALGLQQGELVIMRRRTTYNSADKPLSTSVSWFDGKLAGACPALLVAERLPQGTAGYIEDRTDRVAVRGNDQLAAGVASEPDAAELDIAPGDPVLLKRNRWVDAQGTVIEYGESISPQDQWAFYDYDITEAEQ